MKEETSSITRGRLHTVQLDNRAKAVLTGVDDVDSFNEAEVNLITEAGYVTITGKDLHISHLSLEEGQLVVEGEIAGIAYTDSIVQEGGLFSRLFRS